VDLRPGTICHRRLRTKLSGQPGQSHPGPPPAWRGYWGHLLQALRSRIGAHRRFAAQRSRVDRFRTNVRCGRGRARPGSLRTTSHWGIGFKTGIYYETDFDFRFGASYRSPQWIEDFTFFTDPATRLSIAADYPGVISLGVAYYGIPRTIWALDYRYIDYDNTELFGHATGYTATGAWTGLGWKSISTIATGVQFQLNDCLSVRCGYLYSENPIGHADAFFNVASSAIYQHIFSVGATWQITGRTGLSIAYLKAFENSITGPWDLPLVGPLPGTSVTETQTVDALVAGLQVRF
jgi:long-chain fatty acid transport protein